MNIDERATAMRKFFIHYTVDGEAIKAVVVADSERAAMTDIRKRNRKSSVTFFRVDDVNAIKLAVFMRETRA